MEQIEKLDYSLFFDIIQHFKLSLHFRQPRWYEKQKCMMILYKCQIYNHEFGICEEEHPWEIVEKLLPRFLKERGVRASGSLLQDSNRYRALVFMNGFGYLKTVDKFFSVLFGFNEAIENDSIRLLIDQYISHDINLGETEYADLHYGLRAELLKDSSRCKELLGNN